MHQGSWETKTQGITSENQKELLKHQMSILTMIPNL